MGTLSDAGEAEKKVGATGGCGANCGAAHPDHESSEMRQKQQAAQAAGGGQRRHMHSARMTYLANKEPTGCVA